MFKEKKDGRSLEIMTVYTLRLEAAKLSYDDCSGWVETFRGYRLETLNIYRNILIRLVCIYYIMYPGRILLLATQ